MGCLGVRQVIEYLVDPLRQSLSDEDSYVRKTGVLCVAKIFDSFPEIIEEHGFLGRTPSNGRNGENDAPGRKPDGRGQRDILAAVD